MIKGNIWVRIDFIITFKADFPFDQVEVFLGQLTGLVDYFIFVLMKLLVYLKDFVLVVLYLEKYHFITQCREDSVEE